MRSFNSKFLRSPSGHSYHSAIFIMSKSRCAPLELQQFFLSPLLSRGPLKERCTRTQPEFVWMGYARVHSCPRDTCCEGDRRVKSYIHHTKSSSRVSPHCVTSIYCSVVSVCRRPSTVQRSQPIPKRFTSGTPSSVGSIVSSLLSQVLMLCRSSLVPWR